jgi:hypothetical protein
MLHLIMASGLFKPSPYQEHVLLVLLLCICLTPSSKDASAISSSNYPHAASHHGFWLVQPIPLSGSCIALRVDGLSHPLFTSHHTILDYCPTSLLFSFLMSCYYCPKSPWSWPVESLL